MSVNPMATQFQASRNMLNPIIPFEPDNMLNETNYSDDEDFEEDPGRRPRKRKSTGNLKETAAANADAEKGRRKIQIEYIEEKSKRHITFSKRKAGIMKKAFELSTLTGTQILLLVVSESGWVYSFTTDKFQSMVKSEANGDMSEGQRLISNCLASEGDSQNTPNHVHGGSMSFRTHSAKKPMLTSAGSPKGKKTPLPSPITVPPVPIIPSGFMDHPRSADQEAFTPSETPTPTRMARPHSAIGVMEANPFPTTVNPVHLQPNGYAEGSDAGSKGGDLVEMLQKTHVHSPYRNTVQLPSSSSASIDSVMLSSSNVYSPMAANEYGSDYTSLADNFIDFDQTSLAVAPSTTTSPSSTSPTTPAAELLRTPRKTMSKSKSTMQMRSQYHDASSFGQFSQQVSQPFVFTGSPPTRGGSTQHASAPRGEDRTFGAPSKSTRKNKTLSHSKSTPHLSSKFHRKSSPAPPLPSVSSPFSFSPALGPSFSPPLAPSGFSPSFGGSASTFSDDMASTPEFNGVNGVIDTFYGFEHLDPSMDMVFDAPLQAAPRFTSNAPSSNHNPAKAAGLSHHASMINLHHSFSVGSPY